MAWVETETDVGSKFGRCTWSVHLKHGGARVSVPEAVVAELGWSKATKLKLQVGGGDTEGSLRIVADTLGKIICKAPPKGKGLLIRLGRWPSLAPRDVDKVSVEHEVQKDHGALVIRLPVHAQAVAPAPRTTPASSVMGGGPTAATQPPGTKTSVNDKFFNDPKRPVAMASGVRGQR